MALTADKDVVELQSGFSQLVTDYGDGEVSDGYVFYRGALCALDETDGVIKPAEESTTLTALGRNEVFADPANRDGDMPVIRSGIFAFDNSSGADEITDSEVGDDCYIVDDETVAKTSDSSSRSVAGKVYKVTSTAVFVVVNPLV